MEELEAEVEDSRWNHTVLSYLLNARGINESRSNNQDVKEDQHTSERGKQ